MKSDYFLEHLHDIHHWWEEFIDWENGGVFVYINDFSKTVAWDRKELVMHLRQLYNYSVGHEHGFARGEKIAHHLYETLDTVFPEREGEMILHHQHGEPRIDGYANAYLVICLSRFARTFRHREAAERALRAYQDLDQRLTDGALREGGTWNNWLLQSNRGTGKSDNALIHRCEGALNLLRALETAAPELAETHRSYLVSQIRDMTDFFDARIARPEEGYTIENLQDDGAPHPHYQHTGQSLAHGFEWLGFCQEIEAHCGLRLPFMDTRCRQLAEQTLKNGMAPNGCFRNEYVPAFGDGPMLAGFWPQVEAVLGALWARKRWGEEAFPLEAAERMLDFYRKYFIKDESMGGGILKTVSENGVPINLTTGTKFKCDHHAVRLCEKVLEYDLLPSSTPA